MSNTERNEMHQEKKQAAERIQSMMQQGAQSLETEQVNDDMEDVDEHYNFEG